MTVINVHSKTQCGYWDKSVKRRDKFEGRKVNGRKVIVTEYQ